MISKTEFDAKVESIKKLIGYKELIESDTTTDLDPLTFTL